MKLKVLKEVKAALSQSNVIECKVGQIIEFPKHVAELMLKNKYAEELTVKPVKEVKPKAKKEKVKVTADIKESEVIKKSE